jgi:hypothetical protein
MHVSVYFILIYSGLNQGKELPILEEIGLKIYAYSIQYFLSQTATREKIS